MDPGGVVEIPADGLAEAALEILLRGPAELGAGATGVDGVTEVVAGAVGDVGDRGVVRLAVGARAEFVEQRAEQLHEVDVPTLVVAADAVGAAGAALLDRGEERPGMVVDVQPVADVLALAVDRDGLATQALQDDDGDELLGELIRTVVIGAVRHHDRQAVGVHPGAGEVIARGLAGAIRRMRVVRGRLVEGRVRRAEGAEDFVGRDMQEAKGIPKGAG